MVQCPDVDMYIWILFLFLLSEVTPGSDRENTTVMGGKDLPPMTILEGNFVHTTMKPNHPSINEFYPQLYAKLAGLMDSETIYMCFEEWEKQTRRYQEVCFLLSGTLELSAKSSCS